jgi:hypothetical protein
MSGIRCVVEEAPDGTFSGSKKNDHVIIGTRPKGDTEEERDIPTLLGVAAQAFNQDGSIISRMLIGMQLFRQGRQPGSRTSEHHRPRAGHPFRALPQRSDPRLSV